MSQVTNNTMSRTDKVVAINWQITQGFNALGLQPGQEDSRLAVEIVDLVEVKDIEKIAVKLVEGDITIVFDVANSDILEGHLSDLLGAMGRCGYLVVSRQLLSAANNDLTITLRGTNVQIPFSKTEKSMNNVNNPSAPTAVAAALQDAGIVTKADGTIGTDPLVARRENLNNAEQLLDAARESIVAAGSTAGELHTHGGARPYRGIGGGAAQPFTPQHPEVTPVYPAGTERPTGFHADALVQSAETDNPRLAPETEPLPEDANPANFSTVKSAAQIEAERIAALVGEAASRRRIFPGAKVDGKMSKGAKIALCVGGVALLAVGAFYGGRRLGYFVGKTVTGEAAPESGTVVDAVVAAFGK